MKGMESGNFGLFIKGFPNQILDKDIQYHIATNCGDINIKEIKIFHDKYNTGIGRCAVFLGSLQDANTVREKCNYTSIWNKEILVNPYARIQDKSKFNLFISEIPTNGRSKDLYNLFKNYGEIFSAKVKYNSRGDCIGIGFVCFEKEDAYEKALKDTEKIELNGKKLIVSKYKPINKDCNIYIKYFPTNYTEKDIRNLFEKFGQISSLIVPKTNIIEGNLNNSELKNRGFALVCFDKEESAVEAIKEMNNKQIENFTLFVTKALSKFELVRKNKEDRLHKFFNCNIYVKGFPLEIKEEALKEELKKYGSIRSLRIMVNRNSNPPTSLGYAFVCYSNANEAREAIKGIRTNYHFGRQMYANVAQKKEARAKRFYNRGFSNMMSYPMPFPYMPRMRFNRPRINYVEVPHPNVMAMGMPIPMSVPNMMDVQNQMIPNFKNQILNPPIPQVEDENKSQNIDNISDKEELGNILYSRIEIIDSENAAKITGMLLEMELDHIRQAIKFPNYLEKWVAEAKQVLEKK